MCNFCPMWVPKYYSLRWSRNRAIFGRCTARSMCDICFCISWPEKSQHQHASSHIDGRIDSVDVRYLLCISWSEKSQHASSHIDRFDSPVDVRYLFCISWPEKSHASSHISRRQLTPVFWHKPAFSRFYQIFQQRLVVHSFWENREKAGLSKTRVSCRRLSHIDRFDSPVDVRYLLLYLLARKITTCIIAHRPIRFASHVGNNISEK